MNSSILTDWIPGSCSRGAVFALLFLSWGPLFAQDQSVPDITPQSADVLADTVRALTDQDEFNFLLLEVIRQGQEIAELRGRVEGLENISDRIQGYFAWAIIGAAIVALLGFFRSERRTSQLHELTVSAETASQARTEQTHTTLLDASQKTLNLVNDTLALAKEASGQAAQTIRRKAEESLAEIDSRARELIGSVHGKERFKAVIEDSRMRKDILRTASDLATREGYILAQDIKLTPPCYFIKGIEAYDEGQSHVAEALFQKAADTQDSMSRVLALFWRGYVFNNMGDFDKALESFSRARDAQPPGTAWYYELRRMIVEAQFFASAERAGNSDVENILVDTSEKLEGLRTSLAESSLEKRQPLIDRVWLLKGNIETWAYSRNGDDEYLRRALASFEAVKSKEDLWTAFGKATVKAQLNSRVAERTWSALADMCRRELDSRGEPRHLVLIMLTKLYVESFSKVHAPDSGQTMSRLQEYLRDVDDSEWLFSQRQKRNVPRAEFLAEAEKVYKKASDLREE